MSENQKIESLMLDKQIELARLQAENDPTAMQMKLITAEQNARFALTPVGQELKRFETLQRMGQMYAQATIVPDTYKGNVANCAIALDMATRMNANPVMVMQNLYIVHGNPSWSSKFLIATINTCGRFEPLMYECNNEKGDAYGWRCYTYSTKDKEQKNRLEGTWITWKMVKAEGWEKKNGSKWATMAEQMFKYRAAAFWQRMYAPEISMGFNTVEEELDKHGDITDVEAKEVTSSRRSLRDIAKDLATPVADDAAGTMQPEDPEPEDRVCEGETTEADSAVESQPESKAEAARTKRLQPDPAIAAYRKRMDGVLNDFQRSRREQENRLD